MSNFELKFAHATGAVSAAKTTPPRNKQGQDPYHGGQWGQRKQRNNDSESLHKMAADPNDRDMTRR